MSIVYATATDANVYNGYEQPSAEVWYAHGLGQGYGILLTSVYGAAGGAGTEGLEGYGTPLTSVYGAVGAAYTEA